MSDEISRRPRKKAPSVADEELYERQGSPFILRFIVRICVAAIFLAGGYYGADVLLKTLDNNNIVTQEDVVSNSEELRQLLAKNSDEDEFIMPRSELVIYPICDGEMVRTTIRVIEEVQEEQIVRALKALFEESTESWAKLIEAKHVYRDGTTAYLDLPREFLSGLGRLDENKALLLLSGIVRTIVENFSPISQVCFLIEGRWVTNVGGIRLSEPWGFKS